MTELSPKHRAFVNEYLDCFNATEAYMRVYAPKRRETAEAAGSRLLGNVMVSEAIEARLKEKTMSVDEALARLSDFARSDLADVFQFVDGVKQPYIAVTAENAHLIKKFKREADGKIEVELEDRQAAIDKILKVAGAYKDRTEHTGEVVFRVVRE